MGYICRDGAHGRGNSESIAETASIVWSACHFGGEHTYFNCAIIVNGIICARRVSKLHGSGRYCLCRRFCRLAYGYQAESEWDRVLRRANKLRR